MYILHATTRLCRCAIHQLALPSNICRLWAVAPLHRRAAVRAASNPVSQLKLRPFPPGSLQSCSGQWLAWVKSSQRSVRLAPSCVLPFRETGRVCIVELEAIGWRRHAPRSCACLEDGGSSTSSADFAGYETTGKLPDVSSRPSGWRTVLQPVSFALALLNRMSITAATRHQYSVLTHPEP